MYDMVSGNICLHTNSTICIYTCRIRVAGTLEYIVMCRFSDNNCLIIHTVHEGVCIDFVKSYKFSLTDQDRSLYIYIYIYIIE